MTNKIFATQEEKNERLKELKIKKLQLLEAKQKYQEGNRIEYFNSDYPLVTGEFLKANPKQQLLLNAWDNHLYRTFTYTGGNRTGKTTIGAIIAICVLAGKWIWNGSTIRFPHKYPRRVLYVGQDWQSHVKEVVIPELNFWWPENRPVDIKKNQGGVDAIWIDEKTRSKITIMSNKQDTEVFEGQKNDLVIFDEPPGRDKYIACKRGLVDRSGRSLFCMTLLKEAWVHQEIIKAMDKETGRPDRTVFNVHATMYDNVGYGIKEEEIVEFEKSLNEAEIKARVLGKPSYMDGLVYGSFDRELHLKPRFDVPLDWPVDIAIDTHPRKPHSVLFLATSPRGFKYLIHELRMHGNGKQLAEQIVRLVNWGNYRVNQVICDPLAKGDKNEENTTFDKISDVLSRHEMFLETASKDKDTGILEVKKHLLSDNNEPTIFIFEDLVYTIKEIEGYMWEKTDLQDKEKAAKIDDDMMECLYRLVLLNTEYIPMAQWEDEDDSSDTTIDETTGY